MKVLSLTAALRDAIRYDKIVIVCVLIAGGISVAYSFATPQLYKATVRISLAPGNVMSPLSRDPDSWQTYVEKERVSLRDKDFLNRIIDKLHLRLSKKFSGDNAVLTLQKAVRVEDVKGTGVIDISVSMDNAELSSRIAKALAETYTVGKEEKRFVLAKAALTWLKEANDASERIKEAQETLDKYTKENNLEFLKDEVRKTTENLDQITKIRDQNETIVLQLGKRMEIIDGFVKNDQKGKLLNELKDNPTLIDLKSRKEMAELQLARMKNMYEEQHPDMIKLKKDIEDTQASIDQTLNAIVEGSRLELETAREHVEMLTKDIATERERLALLKEIEARIDDLTRKVDNAKSLYTEIFNRIKENKFSIVEVTDRGFVEQQEAVAVPVAADRVRNIAMGICIGLLVGNVISRMLKRSA